MSKTLINLDRQTQGRVFSFGTTSASGEGLLTINKGTLAVSTVVLDVKGSATIAGDLNLTGNLNITGTINETTVNNLLVNDKQIRVNVGGTTAGAATSGIQVEGTSGALIGAITFDNSLASKFSIGDGTTQLEIVDVSSVQTLTNKTISGGSITGTVAIANGGTGQTTAVAAFNALSPSTTLGDIIYHDGTNDARLAGNITVTKMFLGQTGNGSVSAAPVWAVLLAADIPSLDVAKITTGIFSSARGGTGNGFTKFSGATTSEKTYTLPDATTTILTTNAAVTVAQGGTGLATLTSNNLLVGNGTGNVTFIAPGTTGNVLTSNGTTFSSAAPVYQRAVAVTGTQDASNKVFAIANTVLSGSEIIIHNGVVLNPGPSNDYVLAGTVLTFTSGYDAPTATDVIRAYGVY